MKIRDLLNCMATDTCQKIQIRADNGWIRLFADLDDLNDPDNIVLDDLADMRIAEWYVNPGAEIIIYTDDEITPEQHELAVSYGFIFM